MTHSSAFLVCRDCPDELYPWKPKQLRYGCADCAEGWVKYHTAAFPGHRVEMNVRSEQSFEETRRELSRWPGWAS